MSSPGDTATQPHLSGLKGLDEAAAAAAEAKAEAAAAIVTRVEGEKNALAIVCPRPDCACKIFTPNTAVLLTDHVFDLPVMQRARGAPGDKETCRGFWVVQDKMDFFNIAFSNTVEGLAYLACADCNLGPFGYHDPAKPDAFYIAVERVATKPK